MNSNKDRLSGPLPEEQLEASHGERKAYLK